METALGIDRELMRSAGMCKRMGSAFFGELLDLAARAYRRDANVRDLLERHAHRSRLGLRLGAAAHFRALRGSAPSIAAHYPSTGGDGAPEAAWNAIAADIRKHVPAYDALFERPVQTNEPARAMPVLAAMLALADATALPLRIFEIGSSAGLLLNFDRYRHSGDGWTWGDPASAVHLRNRTVSGRPQHLHTQLRVAERRGCDVHPLDASNPLDAATLLSFVWPDQRERLDRLRAALEVALEHPVRVEESDAAPWIRANALPQSAAATVVLHTVIVEHLPASARAAIMQTIDELAARATSDAPVAWIRMEASDRGYETALTTWPGKSETLIARSDGHAQDLRWPE